MKSPSLDKNDFDSLGGSHSCSPRCSPIISTFDPLFSFIIIFFMYPAPLSGCKDMKLSKTNRTYHTYTPNTRACVPGSLTIHTRDTRAYVSGVCPSVLGSCHTRAIHGRVLKPCVLLWISSAPYTGVYVCGTAVYLPFSSEIALKCSISMSLLVCSMFNSENDIFIL